MNKKALPLALVIALAAATGAEARVTLPQIISSGMVVQRDRPLTLWGTADPGETVDIKVNKGPKGTVTAAPDGTWSIQLPALRTGRTYSITVNDITLTDILVGDVLLCSGQSNMELPMARVMDLLHDDYHNYPRREEAYPMIRQFKVPKEVEFGAPRKDVSPTEWQSVNQDGDNFSAVAFYTARTLNENTGLPVGIINASWGGTPVESWISDASLAPFPYYVNKKQLWSDPAYRDAVKRQEGLNYAAWERTLRDADPGLKGERYYSPTLDDSDWTEVDLLDTSWGTDGMNPRNGSHWLRKRIHVDAAHAGLPATLRLGCIVDADSAWVNGRFVGNTTYQYPPRVYPIPAGTLREGDNVITVQVISQHGNPHVVPEKPHKIIFGSNPYTVYGKTEPDEISLEGTWRYRQGAPMPAGPDMMFWCYEPAVLYNAMISPVIPYPVKGAVWYQGESNVDRSNQYPALLSTMMADWREASSQPDMPFYVVELAGFLHPSDKAGRAAWQKMRDRQRETCASVPGAVLIPNSDLGEWNDIHPLDKKTLGERIAKAITDNK